MVWLIPSPCSSSAVSAIPAHPRYSQKWWIPLEVTYFCSIEALCFTLLVLRLSMPRRLSSSPKVAAAFIAQPGFESCRRPFVAAKDPFAAVKDARLLLALTSSQPTSPCLVRWASNSSQPSTCSEPSEPSLWVEPSEPSQQEDPSQPTLEVPSSS